MANEVDFNEEEALPQDAMKAFLINRRSLEAKPLLTTREALRDVEILKIVRYS